MYRRPEGRTHAPVYSKLGLILTLVRQINLTPVRKTTGTYSYPFKGKIEKSSYTCRATYKDLFTPLHGKVFLYGKLYTCTANQDFFIPLCVKLQGLIHKAVQTTMWTYSYTCQGGKKKKINSYTCRANVKDMFKYRVRNSL